MSGSTLTRSAADYAARGAAAATRSCGRTAGLRRNLACRLDPFPPGPSRFMTSDGRGAVVVSSAAFSLVPVYELHEVFRIAAR